MLNQLCIGVELTEELNALEGSLVVVRTADGDTQGRVGLLVERQFARTLINLLVVEVALGVGNNALAQVRAKALLGKVELIEVRNVDDSHHGAVVRNQCDIDGELVVAFDELACAVQRVNHPEQVPALALEVLHLASLLAEDGHTGLRQMALDDVVSASVGECYGRLVGLVVHLIVALVGIDFEDGSTRADGGIDGHRQEEFALLSCYDSTHKGGVLVGFR